MAPRITNKNNKNNPHQQHNNTGLVGDDGFIRVSLVNQSVFIRKKKSCPLRALPNSEITYANLKLLNKFISERGKIAPSRITNVSMAKQKLVAQAIKRARHLALISAISKEAN
jgi:small subunit ribosomal protein S18